MRYPHRITRERELQKAVLRAQKKGINIHSIVKRNPSSRVASINDGPLVREIHRLREEYGLSARDIAALTDSSHGFVVNLTTGDSKDKPVKKSLYRKSREEMDGHTVLERAKAAKEEDLAEKRKSAARPQFAGNF